MTFNPNLSIGQEISNAELSTIFQCGNMGGMRRSNTTDTLVLVADYTKGLYHDKWIGGILHYTGMGKNGDQNIRSGQNDTLANCATNGVDVHLFEVMDEGRYTYCGRIELVDKPYTETQPGEDGIDRQVWKFPIRPVPDNDVKKPSMYVFKDWEDYQKNGKNMTKKIECVNLEGRDKLLQELQTLSQELYDMREDDRDCHNQILQVFSVTGTVLAVFFGGGFFFESNGAGNSVIKEQSLFQGEIGNSVLKKFLVEYLSKQRVLFLFICIIFMIAITYCLKLIITNMLRYYHIKELQKRIIEINKALNIHGDQSEDLIYWDEFRTAVTTTNPKHISSGLSVLHYYTDIMSTFFALLFCSAITIIQFFSIPHRKEYDYLGLGIVGLTVAICLAIYIYSSTDSDTVFEWIHERALERRTENNKNDSDIIHNLLYLLFPRYADIGKFLLLLFGVGGACALGFNEVSMDSSIVILKKVMLTIIIFDFCFYRARFLINDLRGWEEDRDSAKNDRLRIEEKKKRKYIVFILICIFFRVVAGSYLLWGYRKSLMPTLGFEILGLIIITILYELVRSFKINGLIFLIVGLGYPLRLCVGVCASYPEIEILNKYPLICIVLILLSAYLLGVFSSMLSWAQDVIDIAEKKRGRGVLPCVDILAFKKSYFVNIFNWLEKSYRDNVNNIRRSGKNTYPYPLREKGKVNEIWNFLFALSVLCLCVSNIIVLRTNDDPNIIFSAIEILIFVIALLMSYVFKMAFLKKGMIIEVFLFGLKTIALYYLLPIGFLQVFIVSLFQLINIVVFFVLRYSPEAPSLRTMLNNMVYGLLRILFTKGIADLILKELIPISSPEKYFGMNYDVVKAKFEKLGLKVDLKAKNEFGSPASKYSGTITDVLINGEKYHFATSVKRGTNITIEYES